MWFDNEDDVREWIRARASAPSWIEPTRGSTAGTPDVWVADGGGTWLELKRGEMTSDNFVKFKVRPAQKREIERKRLHAGIRIGVLVGVEHRLFVTCEPKTINTGWGEMTPENAFVAADRGAFSAIIARVGAECAEAWDGVRTRWEATQSARRPIA